MESGKTRERVGGGERDWHRWKEEGKCSQKSIGSAKYKTGQGSGTLTKGTFRGVSGVFLLGGCMQSWITRKRVEENGRG